MTPKSFVNCSSGSLASNAIGACSAGASSRSPKSWSMNCPQTHPHCEMPFSEKRFWPTSLKIRLLTYRVRGPAAICATPSA